VERQRLFISLDLPPAIKQAAAAVQERLREVQADDGLHGKWNVSWTRPEGMHLTLKFLGEVEGERVTEIQAALMEAGRALRPITIQIEGLGGFPSSRAPRVIWLGIKEPIGDLVRIQKRVDEVLAPLGFLPEPRDFHPHLTLGRIKSPKGRETLAKALEDQKADYLGEWMLEELDLMRSTLRPGGAVYAKIWSIKASD
jgi:RNA 2',3'-cyclic 3'-phosphodiesterase